MNLSKIQTFEYVELLEYYISEYVKEFGEKKFEKIFEKIMTSDKISGLISTSKFKHVAPSSNDYLYCLNEIPYFIFSRGQTQAAAGLVALQRWNAEVNSNLFLLSEEQLLARAIKILEISKISFI